MNKSTLSAMQIATLSNLYRRSGFALAADSLYHFDSGILRAIAFGDVTFDTIIQSMENPNVGRQIK